MKRLGFLLVFFFGFIACETKEKPAPVSYEGPLSESYDIRLVFSDSGKRVVRMATPIQYDLQNGDRRFPKELKLYFYDKFGTEHTWLRADSGRFIKSKNIYRMAGNVKIEDRVRQQTLDTDELYWNPETKRIYNDRPVTMKTPTQYINGRGLTATQDFMQYGLNSVSGQIEVKNLPQ